MIGAILGDIIGSPFEGKDNTVKSADFELIGSRSVFTGNTVASMATAQGFMKGYGSVQKTTEAMQESLKNVCRKYSGLKYTDKFKAWMAGESAEPYSDPDDSAALRVSSAAWVYNSLKYVEEYAELSAKITDSHPESVKGAKAVAAATFLARQGVEKENIRKYITDVYYYDLTRSVDEVRAGARYTTEASYNVPVALIAFFNGSSYEDVIRTAVSMGGNSSSTAALAGGIAEAYYPLTEELENKCIARFDSGLVSMYNEYKAFISNVRKERHAKFEKLLSYKPFFDKRAKTEWYAPRPEGNETPFPYPVYSKEVNYLEQLIQDKDFGDFKCDDTLRRYNISEDLKDIQKAAVNSNPYVLKAMLTAIVRQERFVDGSIADAVRFGIISEILQYLKERIRPRMF